MKRLVQEKTLVLLGLAGLLCALPAFAATVFVGESRTLQANEEVKDNFYAAAGTLVLSGPMRGDTLFAAGDATISGTISGDALFVAGSADILGEVLGNARGAGGKITIAKNIGGDIVFAGGFISIVPGTLIGGDALIAGGKLSLLGDVTGNIYLAGGDVFIDGKIVGNANIVTSGRLHLGQNTVIGGDLSYRSPEKAIIDSGAVIKGKTTFDYFTPILTARNTRGFLAGLFGIAFVLRLLIVLAAALFFALSFRKMTGELGRFSSGHFWKSVLIGLIILTAVPFASVIIALTIFGALIAAAFMLAWFSLLLLAFVYSGIIFANVVLKHVFKKELPPVVSWKTVVVGTIALGALCLIPYVGALLYLVFFLASLGALSDLLYRQVIAAR